MESRCSAIRTLNGGYAPLPDLLPRSLEWPLFARKRSLRGVIEPGGYQIPGTEAARVQARHRKVENQLDRFRVEKFWDRVMQEIAEFIAERGPFTSDDILPELRTWTVRGAALHKEPLTLGTLRKKMDVRVTQTLLRAACRRMLRLQGRIKDRIPLPPVNAR